MPDPIPLGFSAPFFPTNFLLLEVDKQMADALASGQSLTIRGREADNVVLCTESSTFQAKDVEVSNSFLLLDGSILSSSSKDDQNNENQPHPSVVAITNHFLELTEVFPSQHFRLKELLIKNGKFDFYTETSDDLPESLGIEFQTLLYEVQMSEAQLREELDKLPLVQIKGRFLWLNVNCRKRFLDEVVELCDSPEVSDISLHSFTADALRQNVSSLALPGVDWFLRLLCIKNDDGKTYSINGDKFVRERAEWLLMNPNKNNDTRGPTNNKQQSWRLDEFEQSMATMLPNGLQFHLQHHLQGLAFVSDSLVYGKTILPLLPDRLPADLSARLEQLFKLKSAWKREELQPYMVDFCPNPTKMEELLMKHCKLIGGGTERTYIYRQL